MKAKSLAVMMLLTISACASGTKKEEEPAPALASAASPASAPAEAATASTDHVWVSKPDGSRQCEPESGRSLENAAAPLNGANVKIFDSRKGKDGKVRAQMCGMPTGQLNGFLIAKADLPKARQLGFVDAPAGFAKQGK